MIETQPDRFITSQKLTLKQAGTLACEFDDVAEFDKEFRKGSTFYANAFFEVTQEMVDYAKEFFGVDISDQIGMGYGLSGMWSDDNGTDWYSVDMYVSEDVYIPEEVVIIPARMEKKWKGYTGV